jgi:hypothetical protein
MAKRKTATTRAMTLAAPRPQQQIITVRAAAPTKRRSSPRAIVMSAPRKIKHHARRASKAYASASLTKVLGGIALASGLIGLAEKSGLMDNLPDVPMIGKKGVVAIGAWAFSRYGGGGAIARDVAIAATALATYQLGKEGKISGEY